MEINPSFKQQIFTSINELPSLQEKFDLLHGIQYFCEELKRNIVERANIPFAEVVDE